ncbi:MFS transporter [Nocardioides rotundus]|uniref:MFS transporter n=1 Tax=Nocardioides rotundus TaxID=1774216 RepID=UPI001CBB61DB|nr:MFS transporter [Nocardioides rotundus]UAL28288.1 MFS transporter [Nocardioides rotundus]
MLTTYRRVLAHPGALAFSGTGLVARLPLSMMGIGIVLLVSSVTGSYTIAGSVSAVYVVANAVFAVVQGRLVDSLGQHRVLPVAAVLFAVGLGGIMVSAQAGWPLTATYAAAFLSGASLPQVGSCVRARWAHVLHSPSERQTAFALEAVFDEVVFVAGPVLVAMLATGVHPLAGLAVALVVGLFGPLALAAQRGTEPPVHPVHHEDGTRPGMVWGVVAPLTGAMLGMGVLFGATEVATIALAESQDAARWSGVLLAAFAAGSLLAGVVTGAVAWRRGPAARLVLGSLGLLVAFGPTPFLDSLPVLGGWLLVCGLSVSPVLIAGMSLVEQASPARRLTEAMGILHTGLAAGVALGAAVAGAVVDRLGAGPAYWVSVAAAVVAVLCSLAARQRA